ncbi:MAG: hypothetical protein R6X07_08140, partial [Desulfatiglandales bacterium]
MNIQGMIDRARKGPEARKIGMVASHLGIVRGASRDGRPVERIEVAYDRDDLPGLEPPQQIRRVEGARVHIGLQ